jgi:hypothetical protein
MGTDVVGGPQNFLPPRSDEFQKLCNREGGQGVRLSILPPLFSFLTPCMVTVMKINIFEYIVMRIMIFSSENPPKN